MNSRSERSAAPARARFAVPRCAVVALVGAALALTTIAALPRVAHACSGDADFNPFVSSEIVIAGRVQAMELIAFTGIQRFITVDLTIEVDRYLKGSGPMVIVARDDHSVEPGPGQARNSQELAALSIDEVDRAALAFSGGSGSCGAVLSNPVGQYWVAGLTRGTDGHWRAHLGTMFGVGVGPDDPEVAAALARVADEASRGGAGVVPASAGNAGIAAADTGASTAAVAAVLVLAVALVFTARARAARRARG